MVSDSENELIGKQVVAVYKASDDKALRFDTENGKTLVARADADCCSSTWIESLDAPELLLGRVRDVESLGMGHSETADNGHDEVKHYGCKITTTEGRCVIDYRNRSNGYYGGWMVWPGGDRRWYGGVYGQQESNEDWQLIAGDPTTDGGGEDE